MRKTFKSSKTVRIQKVVLLNITNKNSITKKIRTLVVAEMENGRNVEEL